MWAIRFGPNRTDRVLASNRRRDRCPRLLARDGLAEKQPSPIWVNFTTQSNAARDSAECSAISSRSSLIRSPAVRRDSTKLTPRMPILSDGQDAHSGAIGIDDHESTQVELGLKLLYRCREQ